MKNSDNYRECNCCDNCKSMQFTTWHTFCKARMSEKIKNKFENLIKLSKNYHWGDARKWEKEFNSIPRCHRINTTYDNTKYVCDKWERGW